MRYPQVVACALLLLPAVPARAGHGHGYSGGYGGHHHGGGPVSPGRAYYGYPVFYGASYYYPTTFVGTGFNGPLATAPPLWASGQVGFPGMPLAMAPATMTVPDPLAGALLPPRANANAPARAAAAPARARRVDAARVAELVTIGDRLFRAGNLNRAVERYEQARRADPDKAAPLVHLSQVALLRGKYAEAANRLREAQAAEPGWLLTAADIQGLYGEPGDFARQVAKLEAHLQAHPQDRDAWLVLGAEWFLSGRTQKAADVFLRLSDRAEEPTLRAFLEASKAKE